MKRGSIFIKYHYQYVQNKIKYHIYKLFELYHMTLQNARQHNRESGNVLQYQKMYYNIRKCIPILENVFQYQKMYSNIRKCIPISENGLQYQKMQYNIIYDTAMK